MGEEFVDGNAKCIDIGALIVRFALQLLGRHVAGGAAGAGRLFWPAGDGSGGVKVNQVRVAAQVDHYVLGLEIQMYPAVVVQVFQCVGHANDDVGDVFIDDRVVPESQLLEIGAIDVVEHHEGDASEFAVVAQADHVGVAG